MEKKFETPRQHLNALLKFRDRVKEELLGQEDPEYRSELEFILERTEVKIVEVDAKARGLL